mgnify:CR=1 FL=1
MSEHKENGKIKSILPVVSGTSVAGKEWKKQSFIVANNEGYEGKEQIFCFEVFGEEKVTILTKFQKVGDDVSVSFNIGCNEYNNPIKGLQYFTSLSAWRIEKVSNDASISDSPVISQADDDDLPF